MVILKWLPILGRTAGRRSLKNRATGPEELTPPRPGLQHPPGSPPEGLARERWGPPSAAAVLVGRSFSRAAQERRGRISNRGVSG